jgi:hypothetical protein
MLSLVCLFNKLLVKLKALCIILKVKYKLLKLLAFNKLEQVQLVLLAQIKQLLEERFFQYI